MAREDDQAELRRQLSRANADLEEARASYSIAIFAAFQKPGKADQLIFKHFERHGRESLVQELRENPEQFGLRQGHILTRDGWRENASAREAHAKEALASLPDKVEAIVACKGRVQALKEAIDPQLQQELARQRQRQRTGPER